CARSGVLPRVLFDYW
nr:immunoglobulin heavy chain junction region [Mus musculus]MBK4187389.1 immunoglobulin heavy chain junction region [Mus musculus]